MKGPVVINSEAEKKVVFLNNMENQMKVSFPLYSQTLIYTTVLKL